MRDKGAPLATRAASGKGVGLSGGTEGGSLDGQGRSPSRAAGLPGGRDDAVEVALAGRRDPGHVELELAEGVVSERALVAVHDEDAAGLVAVGDGEPVAEEAVEVDAHEGRGVSETTPREGPRGPAPGG